MTVSPDIMARLIQFCQVMPALCSRLDWVEMTFQMTEHLTWLSHSSPTPGYGHLVLEETE